MRLVAKLLNSCKLVYILLLLCTWLLKNRKKLKAFYYFTQRFLCYTTSFCPARVAGQ
ncbi:hypothetical protein HanIR_Chr04g0150771 [Helianthus annuus]|nr:hypothetical protein HanIR_Chr04g0150771 [Helianthus annuus]